MRRGKRLPPNPIPPPHPGIAVWSERSMVTDRDVWVARYADGAGYSDSCPIMAVNEAIRKSLGKQQGSDNGEEASE